MNKKISLPFNNNFFLLLLNEYNTTRRRTDRYYFRLLSTDYYHQEFDRVLLPVIIKPDFNNIAKVVNLILIKTPLISDKNLLSYKDACSDEEWHFIKFEFFVKNHIKCLQIYTLGYLIDKNQSRISFDLLKRLISPILCSLLSYNVECIHDATEALMGGIYDIFPNYRKELYSLLKNIHKLRPDGYNLSCYLALYKNYDSK